MNTNTDWSPTRISEFIGQSGLIKQLLIELKAAKMAKRQVRHMVFAGPQGVGKTLLARLIAMEAGCPDPVVIVGKSLTHESLSKILLDFTSDGYAKGGRLERPDLAKSNFLILDEGDQCPLPLLNCLHAVLDPDPGGRRIFQAKLPKSQVQPMWIVGFTCVLISNYIGRLAELSAPTLSRFPIQHTFEWYTDGEIVATLQQYANHAGVSADNDAIQLLAKRANGMPRAAISLFRRALDCHMAAGSGGSVTVGNVNDMLDMVGIDANGLDRTMVRYLKALCDHPTGRLSLQSLQGILDTDSSTLQFCLEPVLMKRGLVLRCSNGREITNAGRAAIGMAVSNPTNNYFDRRIA